MGSRPLAVIKVGGSLLRNTESYVNAAENVKNLVVEREIRPIVVISAMKGATDLLIKASLGNREMLEEVYDMYMNVARGLSSTKLVKRVDEEFEEIRRIIELNDVDLAARRDLVASYGERLSKAIFIEALEFVGISAYGLDARELIMTNSVHGDATVDYEATSKLLKNVYELIATKPAIPVIEGFIGKSREGEVTTLGRGGSDYTATTIASLLSIEDVYLVTNVEGVFSANPQLVPSAKLVSSMDYEEAMEASRHGVKGINSKTFEPVMKFYPSRIRVGTWSKFGTVISRSSRENDARPKILVYSCEAQPYVAIIGKNVHKQDFLINVLKTLVKERIEIEGLEVQVKKPSLLIALRHELDQVTLTRLHDEIVGGDRQ
mgnify:CR=1 FL=1